MDCGEHGADRRVAPLPRPNRGAIGTGERRGHDVHSRRVLTARRARLVIRAPAVAAEPAVAGRGRRRRRTRVGTKCQARHETGARACRARACLVRARGVVWGRVGSCASVCERARACASVRERVRACASVRERVRACASVCERVRACASVRERVRACASVAAHVSPWAPLKTPLHAAHPPGDGSASPGTSASCIVATVLRSAIMPLRVIGHGCARWEGVGGARCRGDGAGWSCAGACVCVCVRSARASGRRRALCSCGAQRRIGS